MSSGVTFARMTYAGPPSADDDDLRQILIETIRDFLTERATTFTPRTYSAHGEEDLIGIIDGEFSLVELVDAIIASISEGDDEQ